MPETAVIEEAEKIIKVFFFKVHGRSQNLGGLSLLKIYVWATEGVLNQRKKKNLSPLVPSL